MNYVVPLPVLLPLFGCGAALMFSRRPRVQRAITVSVLVAVVAIASMLLVAADRHGPQVAWLGSWPRPLGLALVADRVSALMLLVSAIVTLAVLVYSLAQGGASEDDESTPVSIYHPTFMVLVAGVSNAFLAGDLFNLFVSFEMLLFASYVLLTLGGTESRIRAGTIYVVINMVSSALFLIAIAAVYAATGSLNFAQLSERLGDLPDGVALTLQLLLLTVFAIKAAVFPLSFWLPDSYPTAPAPVTAVFAGLLTKVGVYAILRTQTLLFPDSPLSNLLLWTAFATMLVGILGAVAQSDVKRMLSFTLVSHIGYMILGIALGSAEGLAGATFYVVHHITIQTVLFLVVGLIEYRTGTTSLLRLGGLAKTAPFIAILFFIPAMNLAGIPPLSGYLGKIGLLQAAVADGSTTAYVLVGGAVVTSLLTLYAMAKAWALAFWRSEEQAREMSKALNEAAAEHDEPSLRHITKRAVEKNASEADRVMPTDVALAAAATEEDEEVDDLYDKPLHAREGATPRTLMWPTTALVAFSIALTVVAGPLFGLTERASVDMKARTPYVNAVLGDDR
ncbi:Na+/H+ antiporter subunit D [Dermacoccus abyssi]|uniref:Na+/H+ antiporter subunit D n=1 Tax=Dermacoccus abyssi TaxID=322596 RepID=UPI0021A8D20C|nr:Na+/H+ antiporter subunit D [Dermacoccus abyssi]MCT1987118.1 Na+/H+ antiporter subunit D [Dermacoccus abyssi]